MLSGDVHFTYGVAAHFDGIEGRPAVTSTVHQLVCSPIRNTLVHRERMVIRFAMSWVGRRIGGLLRRSVRNAVPPLRWSRTPRIMFNNDMALLHLERRTAKVDLHNSGPDHDQHMVLSRAEPGTGTSADPAQRSSAR